MKYIKVVFNIKKNFKRILIFLLVLILFTQSLVKKQQKEIQAVVGVDDVGFLVLVGGTCVVLGMCGYETFDDPEDALGSILSEKQIDDLKDYFAPGQSLNEYIESCNTDLNSICRAIKTDNYMPVEQFTTVDGTSALKYVDRKGDFKVVEGGPQNLPPEFQDRYFFVPDISTYKNSTQAIYGMIDNKSTKFSLENLRNMQKFVEKLEVTIVKAVNFIDDTLAKFNVVCTYASGNFEYDNCDKKLIDDIRLKYANKTYILFQSKREYNRIAVQPLKGVFLRIFDGTNFYYSLYQNVNTFKSLLQTCENNKDFTPFLTANGANKNYSFEFLDGTEYQTYSTSRFSFQFCPNGNISFGLGNYGASPNLSSTNSYKTTGWYNCNLQNEGKSANILSLDLSESIAEPKIYTNGIETNVNALSQFDESDKSLSVSGDVNISEEILQQIKDNQADTENVKQQIAQTNNSVQQVDETVSEGFKKSNSILGQIKDFISGIPGKLSSILDSLTNLPSLVFNQFKDLLNDILNSIKALPALLNNILEFIKTLPASIYNLFSDILNKIWNSIKDLPSKIAEIFTNILSDIKSIISDMLQEIKAIPTHLKDILDAIIEIPGNIWDKLKEIGDIITDAVISALKATFIPSDTFFDDWGSKFKVMFKDKLPYDTYMNFMVDIKEIKESRLEDIKVHIFGQDCTVVTFKWYYDSKDVIDDFVRGVIFIMLIFFNINQMYRMIRATSLYKVDKYTNM